MTQKKSRPFKFLWLGIGVFALLWSIVWFILSQNLNKAFHMGSEDIQVSCPSTDYGGFPFRYEKHCAPLRLTLKSGEEIVLENATLITQIYAPTHTIALSDSVTYSGKQFAATLSGDIQGSYRLKAEGYPAALACQKCILEMNNQNPASKGINALTTNDTNKISAENISVFTSAPPYENLFSSFAFSGENLNINNILTDIKATGTSSTENVILTEARLILSNRMLAGSGSVSLTENKGAFILTLLDEKLPDEAAKPKVPTLDFALQLLPLTGEETTFEGKKAYKLEAIWEGNTFILNGLPLFSF